MSGHSKWAGIKHQKAITDKKRGKLFTKLANAITVAAKEGGGDALSNPRLRDAVARAKEANMPSANIASAVDRGSGKNASAVFEMTFEGYGPSGVAVIVEAVTDNKNRTSAEVRNVITSAGGKMAGPGAVSWMFEPKGVITVRSQDTETDMLKAIDAGAADVEESGENEITAYCDPNKLSEVYKKLADAGLEVTNKSIDKIAKQTTEIKDEESANKVLNFMEELDNLDDIAATYANFDITQ